MGDEQNWALHFGGGAQTQLEHVPYMIGHTIPVLRITRKIVQVDRHFFAREVRNQEWQAVAPSV